MADTVIKVEGVSKQYRLGTIGTGTIANDLNRWWHTVRGKDDPYLKVGETNDRTSKGNSEYVWALKDIDFEVKKGEVLGIIGRNGAGKSTLLKILSKTTSPTTGKIKIKGRIASLLEVGTGFHPDLSGRDNIYLNGAILGMRRHEIKRKFDEIVDFAGVERYIDTPVKRYSSGMYVRLAFGVAAHLEPDILIVDEVLAVGDAEFQKKCLGKMKDVSTNDGRTVLFVSHQMGTIAQLCDKAILMQNGTMGVQGKTDFVISKYIESRNTSAIYSVKDSNISGKEFYFEEIYTAGNDNKPQQEFKFSDSINIIIKIKSNSLVNNRIKVGFALMDKFENRVFSALAQLDDFMVEGNNAQMKITLPDNLFAPGSYTLLLAIQIPNVVIYHLVENVCPIQILDNGTDFSAIEGFHYGNIIIQPHWERFEKHV